MRRILCLPLLFMISCAAPSPPPWTRGAPEFALEGLQVVGLGYPSTDERSARESALEAALGEFLRHLGMTVESYLQTIAKEENGRLQHSTLERTAIATQGFVQKVSVSGWHVEKIPGDRFQAYARVLVPAGEIARIENERSALRSSYTEPYRKARERLQTAIAAHALPQAVALIQELQRSRDFAAAQGILLPAVSREQLMGEIFTGFEFLSPPLFRYDLDSDDGAFLHVRALHQGFPVAGLPIAITLPSGERILSRTRSDGMALTELPAPAYPGDYSLPVSVDFTGGDSISGVLNLQAVGTRTREACGRFHPFIEASATGTVDPAKYPSRKVAEEMAVNVARHLAYARLVEKMRGVEAQTETSVSHSGSDYTVRTNSSGSVSAQVLAESSTWQNGVPVGRVVLRQKK